LQRNEATPAVDAHSCWRHWKSTKLEVFDEELKASSESWTLQTPEPSEEDSR
jgi:hypothetical protein